jgi:hypothetical protein
MNHLNRFRPVARACIISTLVSGMKDIEQARRIKSAIESDLLKRPGVTGVDTGYRTIDGKPTSEPVIRIYVINRDEVAQSLPTEIEGVGVEVIERQFVVH